MGDGGFWPFGVCLQGLTPPLGGVYVHLKLRPVRDRKLAASKWLHYPDHGWPH
jgi:hypothetical protein